MQKKDSEPTVQDNELKALFSNFDPTLSSHKRFIINLHRRLETIELLHREMASIRRKNRRAVVMAAIAGFVAGVASCLLMPSLASLMTALQIHNTSLSVASPEFSVLLWLLPAGVTLLTSLGIYNLTSRTGY